ncbi:MAG: endo-1,4-beta-xylanase, partial [Bacteroidota bacterium]
IQTTVPALKDVYAKDFRIGCLLSYRNIGFATDPAVPGQSAVITPNGGYLVKFHMTSMTPGNNMKPVYTVNVAGSAAAYSAAAAGAEKDSVDTHPIVRFNGDMIAQLNWAQRQGFKFRGHTLVWHSQTPTELFRSGYTSGGAYLTKAAMTLRMENYIKEVMRLLHESWPGLLTAMDVVNEAINDGSGTFRSSGNEWYTVFGDNSYVMKAFEFSRKYCVQYGENQMKLYYNDYNTHDPAKADGIVNLVGPIFHAGYLDGIGMQEHDALSTPTAAQWITSYSKFDTVCTEMAVTEFDVKTGFASPSAQVLATQANQYGALFKCFVERSYFSGRGKIISVSKDGLNDQYTFVTNQSTSIWDSQNKCKPAFFAVANVGIYYNALDSLTAYASTLQQSSYTPASWSNLTSALASAITAKTQNYSNSVSADTSLRQAATGLSTAMNGLVTGVESAPGLAPRAFVLCQNYPNPFNPTTAISYRLAVVSAVTLKVYDALGKEVATLVDGVHDAGTHVAVFDGKALASGIYYYTLQAGSFRETKKLVLLR